jgi:hypothetical protein
MFPTPMRPVREYSLAELVAKIDELERRRRDVGPPPGTPERRKPAGVESDFGYDHPAGGEPELTE